MLLNAAKALSKAFSFFYQKATKAFTKWFTKFYQSVSKK